MTETLIGAGLARPRTRGPRFRALALALCLACAALAVGLIAPEPTPAGEGLSRAYLHVPTGVSAELLDGAPAEPVRVRVLLRSQPVLEAASESGVAEALHPDPPRRALRAARPSPHRVTAVERDEAVRVERRRTEKIRSLASPARASRHSQRGVLDAVRSVTGSVVTRSSVPNSVVAVVPRHALQEFAARDDVQAIESAPVMRPLLDKAAATVGAPAWWAQGYRGGTGSSDVSPENPADVSMWRDRPDTTHPAFDGVNFDQQDGFGTGSVAHGTATTSVIASQDAQYTGAAHGVGIVITGDEDYSVGLPPGGGADDPMEVFSYSFGGGSGGDDNKANADDVLAHAFGITFVAAVGNSGPNPGTATWAPAMGRNTIAVGGTDTQDTVAPDDDQVADFSSRGPTPGGRKKPDLVAPGTIHKLANSDWDELTLDPTGPEPITTQPDWITPPGFGTSWATPLVSSGALLLWGAGVTDPNVQKAILINSALPGRASPEQPMGTQIGWQPDWGWGMLDLSRALAERGYYAAGEVEGGGYRLYGASVGAEDKTTLTWRLRGTYNGQGNYTAYTVTDLDLRQYRASDHAEIPPPPDPGHGAGPDALSPNDTVEQVRSPAAGSVIYKVEAASEVFEADAEPFALAAAASLQELEPPAVEPVEATARSCAAETEITTKLKNPSEDLAAREVTVHLEVPEGVELVSGETTQAVGGGTLAPGATSEPHSWTVRETSQAPDAFTVTGTSQTLGESEARSAETSPTAACDGGEPETEITAAPPALTSSPSASFEFRSPGPGAGFECRLDSTAESDFTACASPLTYTDLAEGTHSFEVRAIDAEGNRDPTPAVHTWTVDLTPPETEITAGPSGETSDRMPEFEFASEPGAAFRCRFDEAPAAQCTSPHRPAAPLSLGPHVFEVWAIDPAGNEAPDPARRSFTVVSDADHGDGGSGDEPGSGEAELGEGGEPGGDAGSGDGGSGGDTGSGGGSGSGEDATQGGSAEPPAVRVSNLTLRSALPVQCGTPLGLEVRLRNDSSTDAGAARVVLTTGPDVAIARGAASQPVSGGQLAAGELSEPHRWTLRQLSPGAREVEITGSAAAPGGAHYLYPHTLTLRCERYRSRLAARKIRAKRGGTILAAGRVFAARPGARPAGKVRVIAKRIGRRGGARETGRVRANRRFRARLQACLPGRWKLRARYLGDTGYWPSKARWRERVSVTRRQARACPRRRG